jgi:hypothetical protein
VAETVSFRLLTGEFDKMMTDAQRASDKTTRYALREIGRQVAKISKAELASKVQYKVDDPRENRGDLKRSIKNRRRMDRLGDTFYLKVGPAGSKKQGTAVTRHGQGRGQIRGVPLYRAYIEDRYGYMAAGFAAANADAREIADKAFTKAYERYK